MSATCPTQRAWLRAVKKISMRTKHDNIVVGSCQYLISPFVLRRFIPKAGHTTTFRPPTNPSLGAKSAHSGGINEYLAVSLHSDTPWPLRARTVPYSFPPTLAILYFFISFLSDVSPSLSVVYFPRGTRSIRRQTKNSPAPTHETHLHMH